MPLALLIFWTGLFIGCMLLAFQVGKDGDGTQVTFSIFGFVLVPCLAFPSCIGAWVGLQYCMVHSVTLYEARKPLGTGFCATCWKYCRALKGCLACQPDNYVEAHIPIITITLSSEPPVEDIMAYVYGTMSSSTVDKVHTIARLQADGIIATMDTVDGLHV